MKNPIIYSDFPDPDIIRVGDTYYMASTTMHFMPGCDILRSYDLLHWELLNQVYRTLETTGNYRLEGTANIYGHGMWAPSLRYHEGKFYVLFTSNDTHKTHLFTAENAEGSWRALPVEGFYYDSSLFFDDDGHVYIVHGNKVLHLTELKKDLSGPEPGGLERIIAEDEEKINLGFEGSHMYKRNGIYYVFTCHMLAYGTKRKTEVCLTADSLTGQFKGKCIIDDDMGYHNLGVAQGGMVDTPDGDWYMFMFQDRGALGRSPVIIPMHFENEYPVAGNTGKIPEEVTASSTRPEYKYEPLNGSDTFGYKPDADGHIHLNRWWQFNHVPDAGCWSVTERKNTFRLHSGKICSTVMSAVNTLTQRMTGPDCAAEITVDCSGIKDGDYAGLCAFEGCYGFIAVTKQDGGYFLTMTGKPAKNNSVFGDFEYEKPGIEYGHISISTPVVKLRLEADFADKKDEASFFYKDSDTWHKLGIDQKLYFKMDHFAGCRFALFYYSTQKTGGWADFMDFKYFSTKEKETK